MANAERAARLSAIIDAFPSRRVLVVGAGNSGAQISVELADAGKERVVVDPKSLVYLAGMTLNFVRGMMGHGFKFLNPNAKGACGCGESITF